MNMYLVIVGVLVFIALFTFVMKRAMDNAQELDPNDENF